MADVSSALCSRDALIAFSQAAEPRARLTYFIANNATGYRGLDWMLRWESSAHLRTIVNGVRALYNAGFVDLVQHRPSLDETRYIAIWREHYLQPGQFVLLPMVEQ